MGAIGVDGVQLGQIASRGAGGLVNTGKKNKCKKQLCNRPQRKLRGRLI